MCECVSYRTPPPPHIPPKASAETWLCSNMALSSSAQLSQAQSCHYCRCNNEVWVSCAPSLPPRLCFVAPVRGAHGLRTGGLYSPRPAEFRESGWMKMVGLVGVWGCCVFNHSDIVLWMSACWSVSWSKLKYLNNYLDGLFWFFMQLILISRGLFLVNCWSKLWHMATADDEPKWHFWSFHVCH